MTKSIKNNCHKNGPQSARKMKSFLVALGVFAVIALFVCFSSASANSSSVQTVNTAGSETQFNLNIAYAYAGQGPSNTSFAASDGALMSPVTEYPSAVVFNITRLPGIQIASCDGEIEVYKVKIATDTKLAEYHCYLIGTNYSRSFSTSDLSALSAHISDLSDLCGSPYIRGNFELNWTQNTSVLSHSIGSTGCYGYSDNSSSSAADLGLWSAGTPHAISVTVQRIGYITISNGSVSVYKEASNTSATASKQLSNYGNAFLYNNLVPANELPQTDLFNPIP
jgi:hypothetical protein